MLRISRAYAARGLAILVAPSAVHYVWVHKVFKHNSSGCSHPNPCLMLLLLSINNRPICILNVYAPAEGLAKTNKWSNHLNPVIDECYSQGWGVIATGDFNAAPSTLDHSNTVNFHSCIALNTLISTTSCLADSFQVPHWG